MTHLLQRLLVTLSIAGAVFLFTSTSSPAQTKLTYSIFFPAVHRHTILATEWAKEIEKRSGGKVQITMFPGGTLTKGDVCYDGVVRGISDIGMSVMGYTRGKFPLSEVIDLPLGYKTGYGATMVINEFYKKFRPKEYDEVKVMYFHAHGPGILHTAKRPVTKLEELKGMKIRSHGLSAKIVAALGAVPVAMPMGETYDALRTGVTEGVMAPIETLKGWKLGEVVRFTTQNFGSAYSTGFFVVMNKDKWAALPPDIQKIIEAVNEEWIEKTGKAWDEIDREGTEVAAARGNKILTLTPEEDRRWNELVRPIYDEYVKGMRERGLPGEAALKFVLEQLTRVQK